MPYRSIVNIKSRKIIFERSRAPLNLVFPFRSGNLRGKIRRDGNMYKQMSSFAFKCYEEKADIKFKLDIYHQERQVKYTSNIIFKYIYYRGGGVVVI